MERAVRSPGTPLAFTLAVLASAAASLPSAAAARGAGDLPIAAGHDGVLTMAQTQHSPAIPPARDGNVAIQEELEAARRARTREAYDLFIARHPDHPLARTAREERTRLK
jgi:hypothetical protein